MGLSGLSLAIAERAPLPMAAMEGGSYIVRDANPAFCRLIGKAKEELVGRPFRELFPDTDDCVALFGRVFRTRNPESRTEEQRANHHPAFWSYTAWPVSSAEGTVGVILQVTETVRFHEETIEMNEALMLGSVRQHERTAAANSLNVLLEAEIRERKRAEAERAQLEAVNRQLQKAESLGRMAGAIAHTFNNQLGAVIGNLELALMDLPQDAGPVESLTAAMRAARKAAAVSRQMLTYLGQSGGKREPFDLCEACRRSLPILRAGMPGRVVLEIDLPSPGPVVDANLNQIQQVLTNLVTNAWEAAGATGDTIHLGVKTVSRSDIPLEHRYPGGWQPADHTYACLELVDTGCGIVGSDIENLFDPFFSSKFTGRGMGLAVVMGIARAHGGAVTVESEPGQGSTFRVFLPMSDAEAPQPSGEASQPLAVDGGGAVLLVEDEEAIRHMAAAMLRRLGMTVLEAADGVEAVTVFQQRRDEIRCVLCDLTMPRMNGWETITALQQLAPDLPVILASGYSKDQVMSEDQAQCAHGFLGKPYGLEELSNAINQALRIKNK